MGLFEQRFSFFADANYGGREAALKVAIEYRDDAFKKAGMNLQKRVKHASNQRSVTGLLGVAPGYRVSAVTGDKYVLRWYALHGTGKREFSVTKMGMKEAFVAAVKHRQAVTGIPFRLSQVKRALRLLKDMKTPPDASLRQLSSTSAIRGNAKC